MKPVTKLLPEPSNRLDAADLFRQRVIDGQYRPGQRLPAQRDLAAEVGVSFVTVQRALEILRRDGFVEPRGPLGTFVSQTPPHLCRVALIFQESAHAPERPWSRFFQALWAASQNPVGTLRILTYQGVTGHADCEESVRLVSDIRARRVGGLIFASAPFHLAGTPLLDEPGIPRVSISNRLDHFNIPSVYPDRPAFFARAVQYLAQHQRKRPVILWAATNPNSPFDDYSQNEIRAFESAVSDAGMTTRPWWKQGINPNAAGWTQFAVQALFNDRQLERPDSLIIADDNLVEHAAAGLTAAGATSPRDVRVVAYANFPAPPRPSIATALLGYDAGLLIRTCLDRLTAQRLNRRHPKATLLPPLLEEEVSRLQTQSKSD